MGDTTMRIVQVLLLLPLVAIAASAEMPDSFAEDIVPAGELGKVSTPNEEALLRQKAFTEASEKLEALLQLENNNKGNTKAKVIGKATSLASAKAKVNVKAKVKAKVNVKAKASEKPSDKGS